MIYVSPVDGETLGTVRCACGATVVDYFAGWYIQAEKVNELHRRVLFAACPAHHTLYADRPQFNS